MLSKQPTLRSLAFYTCYRDTGAIQTSFLRSIWHGMAEGKRASSSSSSQWPKDEAWKHRPPYTVPKPEEFGPVKWRGRCHCGQITYSLNREKPLSAKYCHCRGCQLMHGTD